ncbi:hypothetical protein PG994_004063 [Apiospora phragmitis]|uniref:Rhodopsin domain-containing protein n=1 Tax=Apiospora phragmitis TaxID=2905665 RepID=A0ABR1W2H8_9PEZI
MSSVHGVITVLPPPDGYKVDSANPTRDLVVIQWTYGVYGFFTTLPFLFLVQNLYVKLCVHRRLDAETGEVTPNKNRTPLLILLALSSLPRNCLGIGPHCASHAYLDRLAELQRRFTATLTAGLTATHAWEMPLERYNYWTLIFYVASTIYTPTSGNANVSLLCFYSKLSPARWWIWCVRISFFFLAGYTLAITCAMVFACNPIRRSWDVTVTKGYCVNRAQLCIAIAALQIVSDLGLIFMPMPMIYGLHIPSRQKIGLALMFVNGSFCVEGNLLIICASFPTIRRFFRLVVPRWIGESEAKKPSHNNKGGPDQQTPSHEQHHFRTFGAGSSTRKKQLDILGMTRDTDGSSVLMENLKLTPGEPNKVGIQGGKRVNVEEG